MRLWLSLIQVSYVALILIQFLWYFQSPKEAQSLWLSLLIGLPLLIPAIGILMGKFRAIVWGAFLLLLYFCLGVMEAWSNPVLRIPALIQVGLVLIYYVSLVMFSRLQSR